MASLKSGRRHVTLGVNETGKAAVGGVKYPFLSLQADSPDPKDEMACLETEHQGTLREVS